MPQPHAVVARAPGLLHKLEDLPFAWPQTNGRRRAVIVKRAFPLWYKCEENASRMASCWLAILALPVHEDPEANQQLACPMPSALSVCAPSAAHAPAKLKGRCRRMTMPATGRRCRRRRPCQAQPSHRPPSPRWSRSTPVRRKPAARRRDPSAVEGFALPPPTATQRERRGLIDLCGSTKSKIC